MANKKLAKVTLDKLAQMVQRGFAATAQDLKGLVTNEEFALLRKDTEAGFGAVTHALKAIHEELKDLKGMDAELTAMRLRLARVERKIGLTR